MNIFLRVLGNRLVAEVPTLCAADPFPQTPWCDAEVVLLNVTASIGKRTSGKGKSAKTLIRTPRTCPKSKSWTSSAVYVFRTGPRETVRATSPCNRK